VKATRTSGEFERQSVIQSPRDCNISSLFLIYNHTDEVTNFRMSMYVIHYKKVS